MTTTKVDVGSWALEEIKPTTDVQKQFFGPYFREMQLKNAQLSIFLIYSGKKKTPLGLFPQSV